MIKQFIDWLSQNYEWVFGGIGVAAIAGLIGFFQKKTSVSIKQKQKAGDNSTNLQIGQINEKKHD